MKSADDQRDTSRSYGWFEQAMSYFTPINELEEKFRKASAKEEEKRKLPPTESLDLNSNSKINDREEVFSEVGPRKRSLSFSGAKDDCFLPKPQDGPKMSLSMFADDDIAENAFK